MDRDKGDKMNRKNLPYSWKKEDFQLLKSGLDRCYCVYNSYSRELGKGCYTVIENCPICNETGIMTVDLESN